jgi:hypothetical protein
MAVNRIYYALTNIAYYQYNSDGTGTWRTIGGGQSAGITSTVNIENFSSFGNLESPTQINDVDFELTVERLLTHNATSLFGLLSRSTVVADRVLGFNSIDPDKTIRMALVYTIPATSSTGTNTRNILMMDCVPSSYSMNCGLEGGLTESMSFQNAGNAVLANGDTSTTGISTTVLSNAMKNIITRKDFKEMNFRKVYNGVQTELKASHVQSVSCSMDFSTEKLNALGKSLPIAKYATYPIECSMEVEEHIDPATNMFGSPVEVVADSNGKPLSLKDVYYNPQITFGAAQTSSSCGGVLTDNVQGYAHSWQLGCARMTGRNLSGGDAGGGNATMQTTFTGYNSLHYQSSTTLNLTSITTAPPSFNLDPNQMYDTIYTPPTTPSPSGNYMKFTGGSAANWNDDPDRIIGG